MMKTFSYLEILLLIAMIVTAVILFAGLGVMAKGGEVNRKYGNRLMRWRVMMQGIAIGLFMLVLWKAV